METTIDHFHATEMRRSALASGALHVAAIVLFILGLPDLGRSLPEERPIVVELVDPAALANPSPQAQPLRDARSPAPTPNPGEQAQPAPRPEPRPVEVAPPPPPPPPPQQAQQPTPAPEPRPAPPPDPAPSPAPPPPQQLQPQPPQQAQPPTPQPRPQPAPQPTPPTPPSPPAPRTPTNAQLDQVLRDLTRPRPQQGAQQAPRGPQTAEAPRPQQANVPNNPEIRVSASEEDAIRRAIEEHWNVNPGAEGFATFVAELRVFVTPDGTVQRVEVVRSSGTPPQQLRAYVESAARAVRLARQLPMPRGREQQIAGGNLFLIFRGNEMVRR